MKIKPDHYATMKAAIAAIWSPEKHKAHETFVTNEGRSKDVAKRVRWDWSYYANLTPFIWGMTVDGYEIVEILRDVMAFIAFIVFVITMSLWAVVATTPALPV
eukprot:gene38952-44159_t